jgi:hypothetical protein
VSCRQRRRFVEKEELSIPPGLHKRATPAVELKLADHPRLVGPPPDPELPIVVVQAATISHPGAARIDCNNIAERRNPILQRHLYLTDRICHTEQ